jgi:hypothetical protein
MTLTSEAKKLLSESIRGTSQNPEKGLRARLLRAIHDEADRRYRLSVPLEKAGLDELHRKRRERIESWIAERARATRPKGAAELKAVQERLLAQAEKEAAATLLNRLVLLRHLEALGLSKPAVVTGGWNSKGYREFREFAPALCTNGLTDATEGYATLLQLVFDELAIDLPGLFGDVGLTRLFPIPAAMLREVVERLDDRGLASAWTDDTTLGWVYQYWNDPDREALDEKINAGGKIEPHEIASKTQMFTERYMVEWLLQNSLGLTWLCMCRKHGWTADAETVLQVLEARRVEWRARRVAGEVALDALMPIDGELEDHWKYFVPQPLPDDAIANAPDGVRSLKILDPACGSGHFLVIAFGLLVALYREEARHRGTTVTDREIVESILENNLFGIDIDPRAIQIAAAALYLKARSLAKDVRLRKVNLVAPVLQLGNLPADDPAVVLLRRDLKDEVGIPEELTNKLLSGLAGVDYLGSVLKVDAAVEKALESVELEFERSQGQGDLFRGFPAQQVKLTLGEAKASILDKLEMFLSKHSTAGDLGIRLDGEEFAAGVRFVRMARKTTYDVVVGNPPYQGLSKANSFGYVVKTYPRAKADLYAAFLERGLELVKRGGLSAMVTMRSWMFLGQFIDLRTNLLHAADLRTLGDLDKGAFETMTTSQLISVAMVVFRAAERSTNEAVALQPTAPGEKYWGPDRTELKRAAILVQRGRYAFDPRGFEAIDGEPIVYWWSPDFIRQYADAPKLASTSPGRFGLTTGDNVRFVRFWFEVPSYRPVMWGAEPAELRSQQWAPFVLGGKGRTWFEPLREVCRWRGNGLEVKEKCVCQYGTVSKQIRNEEYYFRGGIAFAMIGSEFSARAHRVPSVIGNMGSSVYPQDGLARTLVLMNSATSKFVLQSLNPGLHFEVGDVNRLPVFSVRDADKIYAIISDSFAAHEAGRESSEEFRKPGLSTWRDTQRWARHAMDQPGDARLPAYGPDGDSPESRAFVSFTVGVALGRFGAGGEGVAEDAPSSALPAGTLFVATEGADSLDYPACSPVHDAWAEHGAAVGEGDDLRTYLRKSFFDYHKKLYENRPIYFPLSSAKKSFVAFVSIHRWKDDTLNVLLADHLVPTKRRLEGELEDLRTARATGSNKAKAEKRFNDVQKLFEELTDFIAKVTEIAEHGPPPPDDKTPWREVDARYAMDLDDGVMVNSAALWPLLEPQWKDPKKWWKELATAQGKKDYDWSDLAARYFPARVRAKCHDDPSLAVAHGCFWTLHPAKAYAWELRLQDEIRPDFTIDEPGSDAARQTFLAEHAREADEILAAEMRRRERKAAKAEEESGDAPLFNQDGESGEAEEV